MVKESVKYTFKFLLQITLKMALSSQGANFDGKRAVAAGWGRFYLNIKQVTFSFTCLHVQVCLHPRFRGAEYNASRCYADSLF